MLKTKHLLIIFIPAILFVLLAFLIRIVQFAPLYPAPDETAADAEDLQIMPIFEGDPITGQKSAPKTIIVFEDLGCHSCREMNETTDALMEKYPQKIKFVWKLLPAQTYPEPTLLINRYGYCANQQKLFADFKRQAFAESGYLSETALAALAENIELNQKKLVGCIESGESDSYFDKTKELAKLFNIQAVPTFFYNNKQINAPETVEGWEALLGL